jgi:CheY-like chemotaxis protein
MTSKEFSTRVLVVDDEKIVRETIAMILAARGCAVTTAEDGLAALKLLRKKLPDVIISDIRMPNMSGLEFLSIVRRRFPYIPSIALSGGPITELTSQAQLADVVMQKGHYKPDHLVEMVQLLAEEGMARRQQSEPPQFVRMGTDRTVSLTCNQCLRSFTANCEPITVGVRTAECPTCTWQVRYTVDSAVL